MNRALLLLSLIGIPFFMFARTSVDSLKIELNKATSDTQRVEIILQIANTYTNEDSAMAFAYIESARQLAEDKKLSLNLAECYRIKGNIYHSYNETDKGLKEWGECIRIYEDAGNQIEIAGIKSEIGRIYTRTGEYDLAINFFKEAISIFKKHNIKQDMAHAMISLANCYKDMSKFEEALNIYAKAQKIFENKADTIGIAMAHNNKGLVFWRKGDFATALEEFHVAANLRKEKGDTYGMASSLTNIGVIYYYQDKFDEALENWEEALLIWEEIGNREGMEEILNNIGAIYSINKEYDKALDYFTKSLQLKIDRGNKKGISMAYSNIGSIYDSKGERKVALDYYRKAFSISKEIGDLSGMAECYQNMGISKAFLGNTDQASIYFDSALIISKTIGEMHQVMETYENIASVYDSLKLPIKAYEYYKLYITYKDSVFNQENTEKLAQLQTLYETEKKEQEIRLKTAELEQKDAKLKQRLMQNYGLAGGILVLIVIGALIMRGYNLKRKANRLLQEKNEKIENQNNTLQTANAEINQQKEEIITQSEHLEHVIVQLEKSNLVVKDSLRYAEKIQKAIITSESTLRSSFPDSFVIFRPKDIVSGDFLWFSKVNELSYIVSADCTGHGVPGGFMSMIGYTLLNEIIKQKKESKPSAILKLLNTNLIETLKHQNEEISDGMDITVCCVSPENRITVASANQVSLINLEGEIHEITGDIFSVGGFFGNTGDVTFTDHEFESPTALYMFSDGILDQFGGEQRSKFQLRRLKACIEKSLSQDISIQKQAIIDDLDQWQGQASQIDDIIVVGIQF